MEEKRTLTQKTVEMGKVAGAFTTILAAVSVVYGFTLGPLGDLYDRFNETVETSGKLQKQQIELQASQQSIIRDMTQIVGKQTELLGRVEALERTRADESKPAIQFTRTGHSITDARIGGTTQITWQFFKFRDCGRPSVDLLFRNGRGRIHRFQNVSILDSRGYGVTVEPDTLRPQTISYTARIPDDEGVMPGRASGWVVVAYPDQCPNVAPVSSPEVVFFIQPKDQ